MQHGNLVVQWEPDLLQVIDAVEKKGVKKLSQEASQALRRLLTQVCPCGLMDGDKKNFCVHFLLKIIIAKTVSVQCNQGKSPSYAELDPNMETSVSIAA